MPIISLEKIKRPALIFKADLGLLDPKLELKRVPF